jgi:outer membrane protein TolC
MKIIGQFLILLAISAPHIVSQSQNQADTLHQNAALEDCLQYALSHQPEVQQSLLNEQIADKEIKSSLADWFPQIGFNFYVQHNYQLPVSIFRGQATNVGLTNSSSSQFSVTQTIFNKDVLLASSTAGDVRQEAEQTTEVNKINVIVNVTKAYYAVLVIQNQINLVNEDIARLKQSSDDSYIQYKGGVVDKTDYMQATIALNNAKAELRQDQEQLKTSYAYLKEQMGYPLTGELNLNYDMTKMEDDIKIDTTETLNYQNRIEYKLLQTQKRLRKANLDYYIWDFLPSVSAYGEYNLNFLNNEFSNLYNHSYPTSYIGLQLSLPIFQGGKRIQQIDQAKLELNLIDYDQLALQNAINTEYIQAMAGYKSNLNNFVVQKENLELAKNVYNIIQMQYKSGIKTYLDVITAETNLKTTQDNYLYALFQVLISKMDLQKALGTIHY